MNSGPENITLVIAGVGRCGTSLAMQILDRAGYPCVGKFPSYEGGFNSIFGVGEQTVSQARGKAIKIVDPLAIMEVAKLNLSGARIVYMTRNPEEQAKSQIKLLGVPSNRKTIRAMAQGNTKSDIHFIRQYKPDLVYRFEDLLITPRNFVGLVGNITGAELDAEAGAGAVIKRTPQCYPGFIEEMLLRA